MKEANIFLSKLTRSPWAFLCVLITIICTITACGSGTAGSIIGIWRLDVVEGQMPVFLQFDTDGTVLIQSADGHTAKLQYQVTDATHLQL